MKKILRIIFRQIFRFYKREHGKYTILQKFFFPYLADKYHKKDVIKVAGRFRMLLDTNEYLQAQLYLFNAYEPETISFIENVVSKDNVTIDIGANVGYISLVLADLVGKNGKVYSFEAEPNNYEVLGMNKNLNDYNQIIAYNKAISEKTGVLKLYYSKDNNQGGHSTIFMEEYLTKNYVEIEALNLDLFADNEKLKNINLIKIDVEGAEMEVLKGFPNIMKNFKPLLIVEMNNQVQEKRGISTTDLKRYVCENYNYRTFNILKNGKLSECKIEQPHNIENVVFIHEDKIELYLEYII